MLDVGAGIGGPARFLVHATGCHVTALELQPELYRVGIDLTRRSGLADRVTHICGSVLSQSLPTAAFDAVISFLEILHIPDRPALMKRVQTVLRPGGQCYIEDLARHAPFAPHDREDLLTVVRGVTVTSIEDYVADLRQAGLVDVVATDMTNDWGPFAAQRRADWRRDRVSYAATHGEAAWMAQERFYSVIDRLYRSGSLGGVRLTARA